MQDLLDRLNASIDYGLPLPRKVWASWDEHPESREPDREIWIRSPEFAIEDGDLNYVLYVSTNGACTPSLDESEFPCSTHPEPAYWRFHQYDLTNRLQPGTHRLLFRARAGSDLPFLLACLDGLSREGRSAPEATPPVAWRLASGEGWEVSLDRGAHWEAGWAFEGVWAEPYGFAEGGPDDFARLTHGRQQIRHRRFERVLDHHHGIWHMHAPTAGAPLHASTQRETVWWPRAPWHKVRTAMFHLLWEDVNRAHNEWLDQHKHRLPWVLLDAGREVFGRIILRNNGHAPLQVWVVCGESPNETYHYNRRAGVCLELAPGERATTPLLGFQYARFHAFSAGDGNWHLAEPLIQEVVYPANQVGRFRSSDEQLNRIWQVGADTVLLCAQNEIWDAPKRDMLPWMGDLHMAGLAYLHCFDQPFIYERSLRANRETGPVLARNFAGRIIPSLSESWGGPAQDVNGMPSYTAWWVHGLCDCFLHSGEREYPEFEAAELEALLDFLAKGVTDDGWRFSAYHTNNNFIDHTIIDEEESDLAMGALCASAFRRAADLLDELGRPEQTARYRDLARTLAEGYRRRVRVLDLGTARHHAVSAALALGVVEGDEARELFAACLRVPDDRLMTPWWRGYDLLAAVQTGHIGWMLEEIRKRWGIMVGRGQTSLWECVDERWFETDDPHACAITREDSGYGGYRMSTCHAWGAGPTVALPQGVLGVVPLEPGYRRFRWRPNLGDLEWAEGSIPTPAGAIHVRLTRETGQTRREIEIPPGLACVEE